MAAQTMLNSIDCTVLIILKCFDLIDSSDARFRFRNRIRFRNQPYFCWNRNRNRNQRFQKVLESEPESETENMVLESESESRILKLIKSLSLIFWKYLNSAIVLGMLNEHHQ